MRHGRLAHRAHPVHPGRRATPVLPGLPATRRRSNAVPPRRGSADHGRASGRTFRANTAACLAVARHLAKETARRGALRTVTGRKPGNKAGEHPWAATADVLRPAGTSHPATTVRPATPHRRRVPDAAPAHLAPAGLVRPSGPDEPAQDKPNVLVASSRISRQTWTSR
jgi:hypothetical protein